MTRILDTANSALNLLLVGIGVYLANNLRRQLYLNAKFNMICENRYPPKAGGEALAGLIVHESIVAPESPNEE
jgi:hypothetical protein